MANPIRVTRAQFLGAVIDEVAGATASSDVIEVYDISGMSVQFDYGVAVGDLTLMGSNDGITFYAVPDVSFISPTGVAGGSLTELGNLRSRFYRFDWELTGAAGFVKVIVHVKGN